MKKTMKKLVLLAALALLICLPLCALGDSDHVAKIGNTPYTTLGEAITAANDAESGATITLLSDIDLTDSYTISKPVTITGGHTIKRAASGAAFTINNGGVLTLDGGLIIDGGSKKTFDRESFYADMAVNKEPANKSAHYVTPTENPAGHITASAHLFSVAGGGKMHLKKCTVQNYYTITSVKPEIKAYSIFSLAAGAELTLDDGSHITNNLAIESDGIIISNGGTLNIRKDALIENNHFQGGLGGICNVSNGKINMSGGVIRNNTGLSTESDANGLVFAVKDKSYLYMSGGTIRDCAGFGNGGWGSVIYIHDSCKGGFVMTGGKIIENENYICTSIVCVPGTDEAELKLMGGLISQKPSGNDSYAGISSQSIVIGKDMKIEGDIFAFQVRTNSTEPIVYTVDGTINSDLLISRRYSDRKRPVEIKGSGDINGDVLINNNVSVTTEGTTWTGDVTIQDSKLTIGNGTTMTGNITLESGSELNIREGANLSGCTITSNGKQHRIPQGCVKLVPVENPSAYGYAKINIGNEKVFVPNSALLSIDANGNITPLSGEGVLKDGNGDDKPDIAILSGENSAYAAGGSLPVIVCSGFLDSFESVSVASAASDYSKTLTASDFTAERGSTVLTLSESYLNTLPLGDYTVTLQYLDGQSVSAALTVQAPAPGAGDLPHTGDNSRLALWALMLLATIPFLARRARRA